MGYVYRLATLADLEALIDLRLAMQTEVHSEKSSGLSTPDFRKSTAGYLIEAMTEQSYLSIVADFNGQLVAAAGVVVYRKPPSLVGANGRLGYVSNVYTLPVHRTLGIATAMLSELILVCRELKVDKLHLGTSQLGKQIYLRAGFEPPRNEVLELRL